MLIKVTNRCSMGCSHCMEDSTVKGQHMTEEVFHKALNFTELAEGKAWSKGCPPRILLSGGECTEHPDIVRFIEIVVEYDLIPFIITNGMWLGNKELREAILRPEWPQLFVQVTNDKRFYPNAPAERVEDPRICYVDSLTLLMPLGRATRKNFKTDLPPRKSPSSFNLRSITRTLGSFEDALVVLRTNAAIGLSGNCSPSISDNGDVVAGETRNCFKVGTVDSSMEEITKNLIEMRCNRCGLVDNLSPMHKRAIGESTLFGAAEYE